MWQLLFSTALALCASVSAIVGGVSTSIAQYPWTVSVRFADNYICGGSIIKSNVIVTAAHCVTTENGQLNPDFLSVRVGSTYRSSGGSIIDVASVIAHSGFSTSTLDNDIALLVLTQNLTFGTSISAVTLPEQDYQVPDLTPAQVTGWGVTLRSEPFNTLSETLQVATVPVMAPLLCSTLYLLSEVTANMLCTGYVVFNFKGACSGDAGGPLVANNVLQGIVSWNKVCASPLNPNVYTRVSKYVGWINSNVGL